MSTDPYAPPRSDSAGEVLLNQLALKEVVTGWERKRPVYNLILLVPGLIIVAIMVMNQGMPLAVGVVGALMIGIGANVAYFLGPLAELYFRALFRNGEPIGQGRNLMFGAGLVVSAAVFMLALFGALI